MEVALASAMPDTPFGAALRWAGGMCHYPHSGISQWVVSRDGLFYSVPFVDNRVNLPSAA